MYKLDFKAIDMARWERIQHFTYFADMANIGFSITARADVTKLLSVLKWKKLMFYPAYLWSVTTVLNQHKEFRIAKYEEQVGYCGV